MDFEYNDFLESMYSGSNNVVSSANGYYPTSSTPYYSIPSPLGNYDSLKTKNNNNSFLSNSNALGYANLAVDGYAAYQNIKIAKENNRLQREAFNFNKDLSQKNFNLALEEYQRKKNRRSNINANTDAYFEKNGYGDMVKADASKQKVIDYSVGVKPYTIDNSNKEPTKPKSIENSEKNNYSISKTKASKTLKFKKPKSAQITPSVKKPKSNITKFK